MSGYSCTNAFAGAFRRSELVALTVADLVEAPDGFRVVTILRTTNHAGRTAQ